MCGPLPNASDRTNILDLVERMTELDGYLNQYEATLGQSAVTYYFRRRYMHARLRDRSDVARLRAGKDRFSSADLHSSASLERPRSVSSIMRPQPASCSHSLTAAMG